MKLLILLLTSLSLLAQQQTVPNRAAQQYLLVPCPASTSIQQLIIIPANGNVPAHWGCAVLSGQFSAVPTGTTNVFSLNIVLPPPPGSTEQFFLTTVTSATVNAYPLPAGTTQCDVYVTGLRMAITLRVETSCS